MNRPALQIDGLTFRYPTGTVVTAPDLAADPADLVHVTGPNGSGKSTLLRLAGGQLRPAAGTVLVDGVPAHRRAARLRRWLMTPEPLLYGYLTVAEQVLFFTRLNGRDPGPVLECLHDLGVRGKDDALCSELSSGQRRKVWFAVAVRGHHRPLLLLDEPFNDIDAESIPIMAGMITDVVRGGTCVVLSTHVHADVLADEIGYRRLALRGSEVLR